MIDANEQFLSLTQAAQRVSLSTKTLKRRIDEGRLPAYRDGRTIRVLLTDVDAMFTAMPVNGGEHR